MTTRLVVDRKFRILYEEKVHVVEIVPKALESCMAPGTFHVTPVEVTEDEKNIIFSIGDVCEKVKKEEVAKGLIHILEEEFRPTQIRKKGCHPCTNCGACSW